MKGKTSSMLGHFLVGFLTSIMGFVAVRYGGSGFEQVGLLPIMIAVPLLGIGGIAIFLGGIGHVANKISLMKVGSYGDLLLVVLGITAIPQGITLIIIGLFLYWGVYPEIKKVPPTQTY